jgi:hypothetical protein
VFHATTLRRIFRRHTHHLLRQARLRTDREAVHGQTGHHGPNKYALVARLKHGNHWKRDRYVFAIPRDSNVDDLELFYNYMDNTARTLGDESHHELWQKGVPELGFQYPCVPDLILALSALHLARKRPEKRIKYETIAEQHSTAALQAATALMRDMSQDNCPALYISAVLICFTSFAKGPSPGNMLVVADDGQVPWLSLIRGVRFVVANMGWSAVFSGVLAKYAPQRSDSQDAETIAQTQTPSTLAATATEDWRTSLEMISDLFAVLPSHPCRHIYTREVESLVSHLEATFRTGMNALPGTIGKMENIMGWIYSIRYDFVKRLSMKHPVALIILGHFCVLLRTLEGYWFMQGWAQHVMREVIAATDEACHKWLAWPMKFLEEADSMRPFPVIL